jgi:hypothetical protein
MKKIILVAFIILISRAGAQISITSANMPVSGDTARVSIASLLSLMAPANTNYTATGANFNWIFDSLKPTNQAIRNFEPASMTPYFFYFFPPKYGEKTADSVPNLPAIPLGTLSLTIKDIYSFYRKNSTTSFNAEGLGLTMSGLPVGATYSIEDQLYVFPLNYGNRDSTTFRLATPSSPLVPFVYKKNGYRITQVDGWGTVKTPFGTTNCIRVVTTQYSTDSLNITSLPPPFNKFGFPNYARSYQWLTLSEKIPFLEISGNVVVGNFAPTQVRYRDNLRYFAGIPELEQQLALAVFPNPTAGDLNIIVPQGKTLTLEVYDASGRLVKKEELINTETMNKHTINVSQFSAGIYSGRLYSGQAVQNFKFNKQ